MCEFVLTQVRTEQVPSAEQSDSEPTRTSASSDHDQLDSYNRATTYLFMECYNNKQDEILQLYIQHIPSRLRVFEKSRFPQSRKHIMLFTIRRIRAYNAFLRASIMTQVQSCNCMIGTFSE